MKQDPGAEQIYDPTLVTLMESLVAKKDETTPKKTKAKANATTTPEKKEEPIPVNTGRGGKQIKQLSPPARGGGGGKSGGGKIKKGMDGNPAPKSESDDDDSWMTDDAD